MHEQNSIFTIATMGPMIPKKMKYNLHYKDKAIFYVIDLNPSPADTEEAN